MRAVFEANKGEIAGVILEPVVGNSGYIAPTQEFLQVGLPGIHTELFVTGRRGEGDLRGSAESLDRLGREHADCVELHICMQQFGRIHHEGCEE